MRAGKQVLLAGAVLMISSCGTTVAQKYAAGKPITNFRYNPFNPSANYSRDKTDCEVYGAQAVPPAIVTSTTPVTTTPGYVSCFGTSCITYGGTVQGGDTTSTDKNAGLRSKVVHQCLVDKGWRYYNIPPCRAGVTLENSSQATANENGSCYIPSPADPDRFYIRK
jgi:hypothetical protein